MSTGRYRRKSEPTLLLHCRDPGESRTTPCRFIDVARMTGAPNRPDPSGSPQTAVRVRRHANTQLRRRRETWRERRHRPEGFPYATFTRVSRGNWLMASIGKWCDFGPLHLDCPVAHCTVPPPEQYAGQPARESAIRTHSRREEGVELHDTAHTRALHCAP
jgi:hypothetical protein